MYANLILAASALLAQGGALPKGDLGSADSGKASAPVAAAGPEKNHVCWLDLMDPPGGSVTFMKDGGFYFLANGGPAYKLAKKGGESPKNKFTLYRVEMPRKKADPIAALEQKGDASAVLFGDPLEAVSIVSFIGKSQSCYEGAAGLVSVSIAQKGAAFQSTGSFVLARSPLGFTFIDTKKMQVSAMDLSTFQAKMARRVHKSERPLWYDPSDRRLIVFHDDGKNRGLIDYWSDDEKKAKRLAVKPGDKIVQSGTQFAVARIDLKGNRIELEELPEWTGAAKPGSFKLLLAPIYPAANAGLSVNFAKRLALVNGASFLAREQWQKVFIYDYTREDPIAVFTVTGKQYVSFAAIDPSGTYAVLEVRDQETRATLGVKIFNFAGKKFEDLKLSKKD